MMKDMTHRPLGWLLTALLMTVPVGLSAAPAETVDVVVIGNPDLPAPTINSKGLQKIYLGKLTRWQNDVAIVPVMLKDGPLRDTFVETYLDRSAHRFVTYWRQMVFTGKGIPPRSFASEQELVDFVATTPGAIGYTSLSSGLQDVTILSVTPD